MHRISPKSKHLQVILWKVKTQLFPVKNKICISWSTLWVVNSPWLIFPHLSITCWPTTVQAFSSSFTEDTIFLSCFFSPPNAHLINSQAAFYTKSPSFNIFLLTRSLKKELLSFKTSFFPRVLSVQPSDHPSWNRPVWVSASETSRNGEICAPCDAQECFRDGVLQGHAVAIWA